MVTAPNLERSEESNEAQPVRILAPGAAFKEAARKKANTGSSGNNKEGNPGQRPRRKRPLPPGQRLVRAFAVASLLVAGQSFFSPLTGPCENSTAGASPLVPIAAPFSLSAPLSELRREIEANCQLKKLTPGVFVVDPKSGAYVDFNGNRSFAAASMIKVPVLVALFSAIDRGDVDPKKILEIKTEHVAGGSGYLQYRPVGTKLPLMQVAELMIIISDNTATNMIIDLLGGKEQVNKKFSTWGLKNTVINNPLADLTGTNRTSPYDLVYLLARVERGDLMSDTWRQRMRKIMERTKTRTLLNQGLPPGAKLAHKTGDIGSMVGDTGVVTTVDGRKYIVAVQVQRPHNDRRANELIRKLSGIIYTAFASQPATVKPQPPVLAQPSQVGQGEPASGKVEGGAGVSEGAVGPVSEPSHDMSH
ncbi:MAG: serine hydrolase [Candidatus Obscuribacter sp.]|nr:serine hydrolase [Candidatus Melainabacteria bacterium]MDX1989352.1 serine hydrolase [Candidatus Obscuribacter sp.]